MKKRDPRQVAAAITKAITVLGAAAKKHNRASEEMKLAAESALRIFGKFGVTGKAALTLVEAVCDPFTTCKRCGVTGQPMSGTHCVDCFVLIERGESASLS